MDLIFGGGVNTNKNRAQEIFTVFEDASERAEFRKFGERGRCPSAE